MNNQNNNNKNNNNGPTLSKLAVKRLQKEMKAISSLGVGLGMSPIGEDLSVWHANVTLMSGPYNGICFHLLIEVPGEYPSKAPAVFFRSTIRYQNGAQTEVPGKGTSICLDLLGNFR